MSLESVALSFFKSRKVDYYYEKPIIKFPCIYCGEEAVMHASTTNWGCKYCGNEGTLTKLIQSTKASWSQNKIYNPSKEKSKILNSFDSLIQQNNVKRLKLIDLKIQVEELLSYYEDQMSK